MFSFYDTRHTHDSDDNNNNNYIIVVTKIVKKTKGIQTSFVRVSNVFGNRLKRFCLTHLMTRSFKTTNYEEHRLYTRIGRGVSEFKRRIRNCQK